MNERIRELLTGAGLFCYDDGTVSLLGETHVGQPEIEKFAELIASECAQLAMTQHYSTSPADYAEMDPYDQGCDDTASMISGLIRRTFGVE